MNSLEEFNQCTLDEARASLTRCCGSQSWVDAMLSSRPWRDLDALYKAGEELWGRMEREDILEAFTHHPQIGADLDGLRKKFNTTAAWSGSEQASVMTASEDVLVALRDGNVAYQKKFGYIFIVCATGKSASEMLSLLSDRLKHEPGAELMIAAGEQAKITRLRLEKLLG